MQRDLAADEAPVLKRELELKGIELPKLVVLAESDNHGADMATLFVQKGFAEVFLLTGTLQDVLRAAPDVCLYGGN